MERDQAAPARAGPLNSELDGEFHFGICGWDVGTGGCSSVGDWHFDGDPLDCERRQGQLTAAKQGRRGGSRLDVHGVFIAGHDRGREGHHAQRNGPAPLQGRFLLARSAVDAWLRKRGWSSRARTVVRGSGPKRRNALESAPHAPGSPCPASPTLRHTCASTFS